MIISIGKNWLNKKTSWAYSSHITKFGRKIISQISKAAKILLSISIYKAQVDIPRSFMFIGFCSHVSFTY